MRRRWDYSPAEQARIDAAAAWRTFCQALAVGVMLTLFGFVFLL